MKEWYQFIKREKLVPTSHMCEELVAILHTCEYFAPISHTCEEFIVFAINCFLIFRTILNLTVDITVDDVVERPVGAGKEHYSTEEM